MSDVLGPRRRRGRTDAPHHAHDADPWWGVETVPANDSLASSAAAAPREGRDARARDRGRSTAPARHRSGTGRVVVGLALAPLGWIGARIRRSERLRRMVLRLVILGVVLIFLACSVGVILVNNVVIGRSAELGKLDTQRRELRRENALLDEQVARLSEPPLIQAQAKRKLGMVQATSLPTFIFLEKANRMMTPLMRTRLRAAAARRAAAASTAASPSTTATAARAATPKETP